MLIVKSRHNNDVLLAIDKERIHQAVEIDIFGLCIHGHQRSVLPCCADCYQVSSVVYV